MKSLKFLAAMAIMGGLIMCNNVYAEKVGIPSNVHEGSRIVKTEDLHLEKEWDKTFAKSEKDFIRNS